MPLSTFVIL